MFRHALLITAGVVIAVSLSASTGCFHTAGTGPTLGMAGWPIPVSPFFQDQAEDAHYKYQRYERVPILGPITAGGPPVALDPPSDDEIMRALEEARPLEGGLPLLHEVQRSSVKITVDPIADYVDPPRVYPLIGPAQLHHAHYKCTIYFTEATRVGWPIPYTTTDKDKQEVIYIDHNHLHMVGNVDPGPGSNY
jgi:hypothetical protein